MKMKKILSCALCAVMLFTSISALLPVRADAAYVEDTSSKTVTVEKSTEDIVAEAKNYNFSTAQEMYDYETAEGYLDKVYSKDGRYTIAVNRYTGVSYYVNNLTGQILTSNPYNAANAPASYDDLLSQISISFKYITDASQVPTYNSYMWAAERSQISVTPIKNGLRVNYTLGDTVERYLLPGMITHDSMMENIIMPMHDEFVSLMEEYCREKYPDVNFSFFENEDYEAYVDTCVNTSKLRTYVSDYYDYYKFLKAGGATENEKAAYQRIVKLDNAFQALFGGQNYSLQNPRKAVYETSPTLLEELYQKYPITMAEDGTPGTAIFVLNTGLENAVKSNLSEHITTFCTYTYTMMYADEKECDYVDNTQQKPVFRCALEYTFNNDGTLSVSLPASSITFDESAFTLTSITPLKFFGAGDISTDGYLFYPDGSGSILEFDDYYNESLDIKRDINYSAEIYGKDYCYSDMGLSAGKAQHPAAQISMPVFGLVTESTVNAATAAMYGFSEDTVLNNGYFAILEEGASMAKLDFQAKSAAYKYINVYATYTPFPQDNFVLSNTISVGSNLGTNTMVSEAKYTGSFLMRYVMLTDETIGEMLPATENYVPTDYVGMATYYREYLKEKGVLSAMETVSENIPLYIETLGAMQIQSKFLTFPITETIALTTFDDVATMYDAFAEVGITNVNFRLSGFANGGMHSTYPVKLKWEKVCGGKDGFEQLVAKAKEESAKAGVNFGIYPDFDFMYITETKAFDGISNRGNVSRMIDNRYASKQNYNSVSQTYVTDYAMVISSAALSTLYSKFNKKYSKYDDVTGISVSTMGMDLNSNLDVDDATVRETSVSYIQSVLSRMSSEYSVMTDMGNLYTLKYATHILNASTDSGHSRYCSFAIPFVGMILHSYVSYAGTALNYSGSPDYELLRSIESGAAPYYILCYGDTTSHMKEDTLLSNYYSVDYDNWFDTIVESYNTLNNELKELQHYEIVDHMTLIAERAVDAEEQAENEATLKAELLEMLDDQLALAVQGAFETLRAEQKVDWGFALEVDTEALLAQFAQLINLDKTAFGDQFATDMAAIISKYETTYECDGTEIYTLTFDSIVYESRYSYVTDSYATDKDYHRTDYTNDLGNVVLVEYADGTRFLLNYNIYAVKVNLDGVIYTLESYDYEKIPVGEGN